MNLDGYIRVSRVNGRSGDSFISPAVQKERIQAFAKARGHRIVKWHTELDQSGAKADRPKFQEALARVEAQKTGGIAVAKLDRFARSVADAAAAIKRINAAGGELVSVEDGFDSSTPMGKFAMTMVLALGELELDRIRDSWSTAQKKAVERGVHIASRAPTGYKRGPDGRLQLSSKREANAVHELFVLRAEGASLGELAELLERRRVRGPYDNQHWTQTAVDKLLKNRAYLGEARSGRFVKKDAHPAIVSSQEWQAAEKRRQVARPRSPEGALLSGLLRCAGCRYVMKPDTMRDSKGELRRMYRCRGDHAAGRCPERSAVLGSVIEPFVEAEFLKALGRGGPLARNEPARIELKTMRRTLDDAERELEVWVKDPRAHALGDLYWSGLETRQEAVDQARTALTDLSGDDVPQLPDDVELRELWPSLTVPERHAILSGGIDAIMLRTGRVLDERTLVLWRGEAPDDLPSRGRRVPLASFPWPDDRPKRVRKAATKDRKEGVLDATSGRRRRPRKAHDGDS